MKRAVFLFSIVAGVAGILALATPNVDAGSCNGTGKGGHGTPPSWCRNCDVPPGCQLIECSKCGCDVLCASKMIRSYPVRVPIDGSQRTEPTLDTGQRPR